MAMAGATLGAGHSNFCAAAACTGAAEAQAYQRTSRSTTEAFNLKLFNKSTQGSRLVGELAQVSDGFGLQTVRGGMVVTRACERALPQRLA